MQIYKTGDKVLFDMGTHTELVTLRTELFQRKHRSYPRSEASKWNRALGLWLRAAITGKWSTGVEITKERAVASVLTLLASRPDGAETSAANAAMLVHEGILRAPRREEAVCRESN